MAMMIIVALAFVFAAGFAAGFIAGQAPDDPLPVAEPWDDPGAPVIHDEPADQER